MNEILSKDIMEKNIWLLFMAKVITHGHDGIPIEFFQRFWSTIGPNFLKTLRNGIKNEALHK